MEPTAVEFAGRRLTRLLVYTLARDPFNGIAQGHRIVSLGYRPPSNPEAAALIRGHPFALMDALAADRLAASRARLTQLTERLLPKL